MENQKSKFLYLKSKNKRVRFGLISFVSCLILAFAWGILVLSDTALADKPDKPPGQDKKGDDAFQDMPLCIDFDIGQLIPNVDLLCDSSRGITAYAGRRWGIALEINKNISDPYLELSRGNPLTWINGDPDPANDGGYYDGDEQDPCPTPYLINGRIAEPQFVVGEGLVLENIKDMPVGEENAISTVARLIFKDYKGLTYHLFWGSGLQPGNLQRTNPSAPDVYVIRNPDAEAGGKRNWYVTTNSEDRDGQIVHTAFLWLLSKPWTFDYCGAYHVSFSYFAYEE